MSVQPLAALSLGGSSGKAGLPLALESRQRWRSTAICSVIFLFLSRIFFLYLYLQCVKELIVAKLDKHSVTEVLFLKGKCDVVKKYG